MSTEFITKDPQKSSGSDAESVISVLISNYPLANGGYLVSFAKDDSDSAFTKYNPVYSLDYEATKLSHFLEFSSIFLPEGCFYLPETELTPFVRSLAYGASDFRVKLLPASGQLQGLLLIMVDEASLFKYVQEEED